jgi:hypothetical protein
MTARDAAIAAARRGWAVFPCRPAGKQPAVPDSWETRACADPDRVARFWPSDRHNVGIACGPSRLVVVDLDTHGELPEGWRLPGIHDGRDVLAQLCEWARQPWPATHQVATPSGGWHLYFTAPEGIEIRNSASLLGPLVDVRGRGGYVVGAGSVVDGKPYEPVDDMPPAQLPAWIGRALTLRPERPAAPRRMAVTADARLRGLADTVRAGKPGDRTGPLVWAAHRLAEMVAEGKASPDDGELLVGAAVDAGIRGGEGYARGQVRNVLKGTLQ